MSPEQRNKVYKAVLKLHNERHSIGFNGFLCDCFMVVCSDIPSRDDIDEMFPEFGSFRPKGKVSVLDSWFKTEYARKRCIEKCIELTNPK